MLSRLPLPAKPYTLTQPVYEEVIFNMSVMDKTPVTSSLIARWTARDPILATVKRYVFWVGHVIHKITWHNIAYVDLNSLCNNSVYCGVPG